MDQSSLIRRYQEEISQLRSQLEVAARDRGASITGHDPLHPEVLLVLLLHGHMSSEVAKSLHLQCKVSKMIKSNVHDRWWCRREM